jgi:hypothetical protein
MIKELLPYIFYMLGSVCFAVGTGIVIYRIVTGG